MQQVAELLNQGGIIGYPTETVYGLGCDALNAKSIDRIYRLKGRNFKNPLLILVVSEKAVGEYTVDIHEKATILMRQFWPGPLTLLFEANSKLPINLLGGSKKIGIRVSPDHFCQQLLGVFKKPLVSTSANPAGFPPAKSSEEVHKYFGDSLDMIIDDGDRRKAEPSTVVDVTEAVPKLVRKGAISKTDIEAFIGEINE